MIAAQVFSVVLGMFLVAQSSAADVWTTPIPLLEVNSSAEEWSPFLSSDGLTLYFARVRSPTCYYGQIWEAIRDTSSGPFTIVQEVVGELNAVQGHVVCGWVSPDNLRMYYHTEINGVFALQVSERCSVYDPWPAGIPIPGLEGLGRRLQMPRLTADEKTVIFDASDIPGGQGGYDLWMATRPHLYAPFENVTNLQELNTASSELPGSTTSDGLTVYFSSNRDGSHALFRATRETVNSPFGPPVHLSFFDVPGGFSMHPNLAQDGNTLYFMAQQGSDPTTRDVWVSYAVAPVSVQPELPLPPPSAWSTNSSGPTNLAKRPIGPGVPLEIRISKPETSTNDRNPKFETGPSPATAFLSFELWISNLFRISDFRNGAGQQASACGGVVDIRVPTQQASGIPRRSARTPSQAVGGIVADEHLFDRVPFQRALEQHGDVAEVAQR